MEITIISTFTTSATALEKKTTAVWLNERNTDLRKLFIIFNCNFEN